MKKEMRITLKMVEVVEQKYPGLPNKYRLMGFMPISESAKLNRDTFPNINPRQRDETSKPGHAMTQTLAENAQTFVYKNQGVTILASHAKKSATGVTIVLNTETDGLFNGGTSQRTTANHADRPAYL